MLARSVFCCLVLLTAPALAQTPPAAPPPEFDLAINHAPMILVAGTPATLSVTITPHAPWQLKTTTPFAATFSSPAAIEFKQNKYTARDFTDAKAPAKTITATFVPKEAGEHKVGVDVMFFLCSEQVCQRHKEIKEYVLPVTATP